MADDLSQTNTGSGQVGAEPKDTSGKKTVLIIEDDPTGTDPAKVDRWRV